MNDIVYTTGRLSGLPSSKGYGSRGGTGGDPRPTADHYPNGGGSEGEDQRRENSGGGDTRF